MQPFNIRTIFTLLLALAGYYVTHRLFRNLHGITGLVLRTVLFMAIYLSGALLLKLSPDIIPVWNTLRKKMTIPYLRSRK
jgi:hypothetical protein